MEIIINIFNGNSYLLSLSFKNGNEETINKISEIGKECGLTINQVIQSRPYIYFFEIKKLYDEDNNNRNDILNFINYISSMVIDETI